MALPSVNYSRPRLAATNSEAIVLEGALYDDTSNGRFIVDVFAAAGGNDRLIQRLILTPNYNGSQFTLTVTQASYQSSGASTYDSTNLASATTAPFTVPSSPANVGRTAAVDLDVIWTAAGDLRT